MDQYESPSPWGRPRHTEDVTPIYDRLLAEWQAARVPEGRAPRGEPGPSRAEGLVPGARVSGEALGS